MVNADKYYGRVAKTYDADRCHSLRWAKEQQAVADFVSAGPVLDAPIGTGRYVSIYRDKGLDVLGLDVSRNMLTEAIRKYPGLNVQVGNVLMMPFPDGTFETAVCTRLLDWLCPDEMGAAVAELRRVARTLVVSIRHGVPGVRVNYTHDLARFYQQIDGLFTADRRVTEITNDGADTEEIFLLRPPTWADVVQQFRHHGHTPEFEMLRLAREWEKPFGIQPRMMSAESTKVRAEYWTAEQLGAVIDDMAKHVGSYATDEPPRFNCSGPATILHSDGRLVVLDGRRRINAWRRTPGRYPVLVVE